MSVNPCFARTRRVEYCDRDWCVDTVKNRHTLDDLAENTGSRRHFCKYFKRSGIDDVESELNDSKLICGVTDNKTGIKSTDEFRTPTVPCPGSPTKIAVGVYYKAIERKIPEEWDKLVQNPFLAFYQRWPWFAHKTPLINLWTHNDIAVIIFVPFFTTLLLLHITTLIML